MRRWSSAAALALFGIALASCGSSVSAANGTQSNPVLSSGGFQSPLTQPLTGGKRGGVLEVLNESDFEHLDPGQCYYLVDYEVVYATQRPLYAYKPNETQKQTPDLASGPPRISADGKTVVIHLREGVHFSPPVNREVTSQDVAYAIERGANPYIQAYYGAVEGMPTATGGPVKGIVTPDRHTIVFKLTEPTGKVLSQAMVLPLSAPVPEEYAASFDKHSPSDYGNYQVATGPYMLKHDRSGKVLGVGYVTGESATLVRNPNWNAASDIRPAYLDEVQVKIGGDNTVIGRQVLEGDNVVQNERPAQPNIRLAAERYKDQLEISPGAGEHYIAVNNRHGPFRSINLRKAFWAALDREAMNKVRGGKLVTNVMTHFIYPTVPGFEEAGGVAGPKLDFNEHPEGSPSIAAKYMKLAGYPGGKYTGNEPLRIVGVTGNPSAQDAEIVDQTLQNLGFTTKFTLVNVAPVYAKYCGVPQEEIDVCPSVGWTNDFADPQATLDVTFNGKRIAASGNANWSQTNAPKLNAAIAAAEPITDSRKRIAAWANIDREIVELAAAVPYDWDKQPNIEGSQVKGVGDLWNGGAWDYSWTSLK
jgi:peptide/nickel transport system substrate-binding protein